MYASGVPYRDLQPGEAYDRIAQILGCKWSMAIFDAIDRGSRRPAYIERACPGLSATVLHRCLRRLERDGLLSRTVYAEEVPLRVEYGFTEQGERLLGILRSIRSLAGEWRGTQPVIGRRAIGENRTEPGGLGS